MNTEFIKRILLASSAWITWGILFALFTAGVKNDDGRGNGMGWIAVAELLINTSLLVSLVVSVVLIVKLKSQANTSPLTPNTGTWPFLVNYSFIIYYMYFIYSNGVTLELFAYYCLPILLPQTILLIIYLALQKKYLSAHA